MSWDWTAVGTVGAALATVVVASVTAWLSWQTRSLARETKRDVEAQWMPLLLPPTMRGVTEEYENLHLNLVNSGRGPALRGFIWTEGDPKRLAYGSFHVAAGQKRDPVKTPMPPGGVSTTSTARVHVEWEDLTGNIFEAIILVGRDGRGVLTVVDVDLVKDKPVRDAYNLKSMVV